MGINDFFLFIQISSGKNNPKLPVLIFIHGGLRLLKNAKYI